MLISYLLLLEISLALQLDTKSLKAFQNNIHGSVNVRIFHPAFPTELLTPLKSDTALELLRLKESLGSDENIAAANEEIKNKGLPWQILPMMGVSDSQNIMPKRDINEYFDRYRHHGHVVWAQKLDKLKEGCVILNHWKQQAIVITEYEPSKGAKGFMLCPANSGPVEKFEWPPLTLEIEIRERKWQISEVSDNILTGEVLSLLPSAMSKSPWELIFLLLLSKDDDSVLQALFDTGLSPRQGLIAYIRLLKQVELRTEAWDDVPQYRLISERDVEI
eukprot:CAMPEP_0182429018 /NCGR_PEP_ID=MMETSP1167-20130531/25454_1 /TAXON_ID=2988 /ORGANISM="Mallomonas Sp, Strain CCMP3275" /LENGTH=275 /DNA_ID=CAMNT_0024612313 /DNA_START=44 /DNA_END=871 /DNA_ORIENTATION=+